MQKRKQTNCIKNNNQYYRPNGNNIIIYTSALFRSIL